jgi:hypothetical protein
VQDTIPESNVIKKVYIKYLGLSIEIWVCAVDKLIFLGVKLYAQAKKSLKMWITFDMINSVSNIYPQFFRPVKFFCPIWHKERIQWLLSGKKLY